METRRLLLEKSGHTVLTATNEDPLKTACEQNVIDVAVIGQTMSVRMKRRVLSLVRTYCPAAQVLELYASSTGRILQDADAWLEVPADVPATLPEKVASLVTQEQSRKISKPAV
ncbi:MAG: hypothetical protein DMG65_18515 [Candidatus Angelobacter sp. Gp1-AA117]|nr:MAG: hypothetical protein DMG65_18515 [Candidatus Angelobacter sp. Gp1-AA117]